MQSRFQQIYQVGLIFILLITSCCRQDASHYGVINIAIDQQSEKTIEDYLSHIEIIPLETNRESVIRNIRKVVEYGNNYYIQNAQESLLVFDNEGFFVQAIGKAGRGPGEFNAITDFQINTHSNNIEILEPRGTIKIYNLNGDFLHSIHNPTKEVSAFSIIDKDLILFSHNRSDCALDLFSRKDKKIIKRYFEFSEDFFMCHPLSVISHTYNYGDELYVHHGYTNEVYKFKNTNLELIYKFEFNNRTFDVEAFLWPPNLQWDKYLNVLRDNMYVFGFHNEYQTDRFLIMMAYYKNDEIAIILDKNNNESTAFTHIKDLIKYDMSEVDKYINLWANEISSAGESGSRLPPILNRDSGAQYALCSFDFKRRNIYINPSIIDSANLVTFNNIDITDNPVLVKYYFIE